MTKNQKVSVVVPMYNSEKFIQNTLSSILTQTYQDFEIIVVDDISTDNSFSIVSSMAQSDERIRLFQLESKGGASIARNLALREATGRYIAFLDADDRWYPTKLEKQVSFMRDNDYLFTYTKYEVRKEDSINVVSTHSAPRRITYPKQIFGNSIGCLTVMYDANAIGLIQIPKIDKRNDVAIWQRALKIAKSGYLLPEVLASYTLSENSVSRSVSKTKILKYHYVLYRTNLNYNPVSSAFFTGCNVLNYAMNKVLYITD